MVHDARSGTATPRSAHEAVALFGSAAVRSGRTREHAVAASVDSIHADAMLFFRTAATKTTPVRGWHKKMWRQKQEKERDRQTDRQTERERQRERERERQRETGRQAGSDIHSVCKSAQSSEDIA